MYSFHSFSLSKTELFLSNLILEASRIKLDRNSSVLDNENEWNEYIDWSIEKLEKFYHVFRSKIKNLD